MTWRSLDHPNVLPLLGVTMDETRFVMVSEWMENGNINEFLEKNPDVDRLNLVRSFSGRCRSSLMVPSFETSLGGWSTCMAGE